jgi:hypothetical protein
MSEKTWGVQTEPGQSYGLGNRNKNAGENPGASKPNQRDEKGNPIGISTFAGAASPEHGLPTADDGEE